VSVLGKKSFIYSFNVDIRASVKFVGGLQWLYDAENDALQLLKNHTAAEVQHYYGRRPDDRCWTCNEYRSALKQLSDVASKLHRHLTNITSTVDEIS